MLPLCPCHNDFWKKFLEFIYHDDTVEVSFVWKVVADNTSNLVVHEIANDNMVFLKLKRFFGITIFCPIDDT